jgi:SAM-dependent methyltransferase
MRSHDAEHADLCAKVGALKDDFPWSCWVDAWDASQDAEVPARRERFGLIADLVASGCGGRSRVLDIGVGPGSLSRTILERHATVRVVGIDANPFLVYLGQKSLARFGDRVRILEGDLRSADGWRKLRGRFDAVVAGTTIHWFEPHQLKELWGHLLARLRPGGRLLVSDCASSPDPATQAVYERARGAYLRASTPSGPAPWQHFWEGAGNALNFDFRTYLSATFQSDQATDDGLPFATIAALLHEAGFGTPEIHWQQCGEIVFGARAPDATRVRSRNRLS